MRLGLTQSLRTEQRLIQSPQMIQAMQVLQLPLLELKDQVDQELQENVFLERKDDADRSDASITPDSDRSDDSDHIEDRLQREFAAEIDQLEARIEPGWRQNRATAFSGDDEDKKLEALNNTPGRATSLAEYLMTQVRTQESDEQLIRVIEHIVYSLDEDGRFARHRRGSGATARRAVAAGRRKHSKWSATSNQSGSARETCATAC